MAGCNLLYFGKVFCCGFQEEREYCPTPFPEFRSQSNQNPRLIFRADGQSQWPFLGLLNSGFCHAAEHKVNGPFMTLIGR